MSNVNRDLGVTIDVRRDVVMWHVVLCVGAGGSPCGVSITQDPLDHAHLAQVVCHKTRSLAVAHQVARHVRRVFGVTDNVSVVRANRPREAMVAYACTRTAQHPPGSYDDSVYRAVVRMSSMTVQQMLDDVTGGHNASRTRYVVYEVRSASLPPHRGVTNKFNALERRYREAPPDTMTGAEIVQVARLATSDEARDRCAGFAAAGDHLWTRKPPVGYLRRILEIRNGELVWTCDGSSAVRTYDFDAVVVGPHVYTESQIRHVMEHGVWADGRRRN